MKKILILTLAVFVLIVCASLCVGYGFEYERIDTVYMNEVTQALSLGETPESGKYDFTLFSKDGGVLYTTVDVEDMTFDARINRAAADGDAVLDFKEDKIVFYTGGEKRFEDMRRAFILYAVGAVLAAGAAMCAVVVAVYWRTLRPFAKLKDFAGEVARGNLDFPLAMDRYGSFGAFSEAFDIMRNNLKESRLAEQKAAEDKRRLVQEIGHDIKTPLASIKAIAECAAAEGKEDFDKIFDKVGAIENLVNDFYNTALEEEGRLGVYMTRHTGEEFARLIDTCDYNSRVTRNSPPECVILYDKVRMSQILDNIIVNSYKYADTDIEVGMSVEGDKFKVRIRDFGDGVEPEQLSFITDRFYRGKKTNETLGQGLGLHICAKLIARMGGEMICFNDGGFVVEIFLPVSV